MADFKIYGTGSAIYVWRDGARVAGPFTGMEMAELAIDVMERNAAKKKRKCLCCSTPFLSWGGVNAMKNHNKFPKRPLSAIMRVSVPYELTLRGFQKIAYPIRWATEQVEGWARHNAAEHGHPTTGKAARRLQIEKQRIARWLLAAPERGRVATEEYHLSVQAHLASSYADFVRQAEIQQENQHHVWEFPVPAAQDHPTDFHKSNRADPTGSAITTGLPDEGHEDTRRYMTRREREVAAARNPITLSRGL